MRIRLALMGSGIIVLAFYLIAGGPIASKSVIRLEFGMYPEEFEGLEVTIDGESVGHLQRFGAAFRTGFQVEDGQHIVEVISPDLPCEPLRVTSGRGGRHVLLVMDVASFATPEGKVESRIVLR